MDYAERCKAKGIKLELTPHEGRCWKKQLNKKREYFMHPLTEAGYNAAVEEYHLLKAKIAGERPHFATYKHNLDVFGQVLNYWKMFGTPASERKLKKQVEAFVAYVEELLTQPKLEPRIPGILGRGAEFTDDFVMHSSFLGDKNFVLGPKWVDRINRLTPSKTEKLPQTIEYWAQAYLDRVEARIDRNITRRAAKNRGHKLQPFKEYADLQAHITTIDDDTLEKFHEHIDDKELAKSTKEGYFRTFTMFVGWCAKQKKCELVAPANLGSKEYSFREPSGTGRKRMEKKKHLWTKEDVDTALKKLPQPYPAYIMLMLNAGFRHVDVSELRHSDIDWEDGRIIIQRHKLSQLETAPVVSYKLWDKTLELIKANMTDPKKDEIVFRNLKGGQVEGSIKIWWRRNAKDFGCENKRLDYLRKTGSTTIAKYDRGLDEIYLGESLKTVTKINYSFTDGEPCPFLDKGINHLGQEFGFAEEPPKMIELTPEVLKALKKAKIAV